ncbi:MAG: hypothetical protein HC812_14200 [Leptolyngbya sp. RL_3_1]|nr:hypothetical protein [Leptolyngbya sp. RL_3_1]
MSYRNTWNVLSLDPRYRITTKMFLYLLPAALTLGLALEALLQDQGTSLQEADAWFFLALITVLWPLTLPSMVWHKYQQYCQHRLISSQDLAQ